MWAILHLLLYDRPVEVDLPEPWRAKWNAVAGGALPHTLHDADDERIDVENRLRVAHRNREVAERLLHEASQYWF